jgi:hypothetical protein
LVVRVSRQRNPQTGGTGLIPAARLDEANPPLS